MSGTTAELALEVGQFSHPGRKRSNNEDWLGTFLPHDPERLARKGSLFLVADGMGGHKSGEMASRFAADLVIRHYVDDPSPDITVCLRQAIESANDALYTKAAAGDSGGRWGTTLVAAVVRGNRLWIGNVGDSRAYLLRKGSMRQLSRDHALAAELGVKEPGQWVGRHVVTRALGQRPDVKVDVFAPVTLQPGDRLLLCSDGLTTPLADPEIRRIAARGKDVQQTAVTLVEAANESGGPDNVSVVLVQAGRLVGNPGPWAPALWLERLGDRQTGQQIVFEIEQVILGKNRDWKSPWLLGTLIVSAVLLVMLGFLLGWAVYKLL